MIKTKASSIRSLEENAYYHGVVCKMIADDRRWQSLDPHRWIKMTFGVESTASLTTVEFERLMNDIRSHVSIYFGIRIPLPNED